MIPKIGIFAQRREYAGRLFNNLAFDYIRAVEKASGRAIVIPAFTEYLDAYIDECSAFIFPGWSDIDPSLYGQESAWARGANIEYDRFLYSAMEKITLLSKPVLGICKGMQLINIVHGGTLKQDVEEYTHHFQPERGYDYVDEIRLEANSFLEMLYKRDSLSTNSIHHQAVDRLGRNLKVVAKSSFDDEIEAIEHLSLPHYGVQWHPEYFGSRELFEWFISLPAKPQA